MDNPLRDVSDSRIDELHVLRMPLIGRTLIGRSGNQ